MLHLSLCFNSTIMPVISEALLQAILPIYTASEPAGSPASNRKPENRPKEPLQRMEEQEQQMEEELHRLDERLRQAKEKSQQRDVGQTQRS